MGVEKYLSEGEQHAEGSEVREHARGGNEKIEGSGARGTSRWWGFEGYGGGKEPPESGLGAGTFS